MKNILGTIVVIFFSYGIDAQNAYLNKQDRAFFSNEIFVSGSGFWDSDNSRIGIGYERTVFRFKNRKNDYISWQNELQFLENAFSDRRFYNTVSESIIKYNRLDKFSVFSFGAGGVLYRQIYFNPVLRGEYKYFVKKSKLTIAIYGEMGFDLRNHQNDTLQITGTIRPLPPNVVNWWGGITIGKYF